jgi:hypothetical protein
MKIKLVFLEKGLETYFGVKPECSDLYFCSNSDGNNKTSHLFKHLIENGASSWISTESVLDGNITLEKWLDVDGEIEEWLLKKVKEFEFLTGYNNGHYGTNS